MSTGTAGAQLKYPALRDLSPGAQAAAAWFRALARALKTCRLYSPSNPAVLQTREQLHEQLSGSLEAHGAWRVRVTPTELWLLDEPIVHPSGGTGENVVRGKEEQLPFLFYRDGIRSLTFLPKLSKHDFDALFDAMLGGGNDVSSHDDLVTLLWQANPTRIVVEAVPASQTIYLSSHKVTDGAGGGGGTGIAYDWSPSGEEIHADIGQIAGAAQGLHLDTFDDWPLPPTYVDVPSAYAHLVRGMEFVRSILLSQWAAERAAEWQDEVRSVFERVLELDPSPDTRAALAQSLVSWLSGAIQRCAWAEAGQSLRLLREIDPGETLSGEQFASAIAELDCEAIAERLDESEEQDQERFFAMAVTMGRPALDLAIAILGKAQKARTRAAACTMLCYLCADQPDLLAPYLTDARWYVVRNTVFVLGQIGGPAVVDLLDLGARHPDPRVRRQVIQSVGNVPPDARLPILVRQLQTEDLRLLSTTLAMMARWPGPETTRALLHQVQAPDFESRSPEHQRLIFNALAELADDEAVPALAAMVSKRGWFARRTPQRTAAAHALARIGTEKALAVLEEGARDAAEAIRAACLDALAAKGRT